MQWGIDYQKVQIPKNRDTFLERHAGYRDTLETEKYSYVPNLVKYVYDTCFTDVCPLQITTCFVESTRENT